ncbi:hypothetical protein O6H91_06G010000 [Diphasiastrum complanatum]|uniref:Uncharacterized protein n=1 Tax=Diphasiastrum complanatum TaxID=34168 RepID=A0ACC2DAP9_DIPCM|nr:hypothetical protein O6H91_06G010000 [Diphasiastrum complanatum]
MKRTSANSRNLVPSSSLPAECLQEISYLKLARISSAIVMGILIPYGSFKANLRQPCFEFFSITWERKKNCAQYFHSLRRIERRGDHQRVRTLKVQQKVLIYSTHELSSANQQY